jgi:tetratricopeptide (TPR) repeat protein
MEKPIQVFCCYAHEDQPFLLQLKKQLKPLERDGLIVVQADIDVFPGEEWEQKISHNLNTAQMILLLVSSDFIVSEYCYSIEMAQALARHERGEAIVIPIILRPVHWQGTSLGKLEALPKNAIAVVDRSWQNQDEAFFNVAEGIRNIVEKQRMTSTTSTHHNILGYPPPTDPRTIQQREEVVKDVYMQLVQPDSTAVVLTGIGGLGKSTLAALVYRHAEEQRQANNGLFTAEALWLTIDRTVTMVDLAMTLFEALSTPVPDFSRLPPRNQALALFHALDRVDQARLIILDQFEHLLGSLTGHTFPDHPGVGEWLDVINSQKCKCRILLTSRPWPQGIHEYPPNYMQEFRVQGLNTSEGASLLRKQGVKETQATVADLQQAVKRCDGHALALTLLASILRKNRSLSLKSLFQDPSYVSLWPEHIAHARDLLHYIYTKQLDDSQRTVLRAFSIYREPVPLDAAHSLLIKMPNTQILNALNVLLTQHLLNAVGEGRYQLHAIVASYARAHFIEGDEQANLKTVREMHRQAAQYYLQQATKKSPPRGKRHSLHDVQPLIEASWQYCQAEKWRSAWNLMQREGIFPDVRRWGGNAILLELYQLLLPVDTWLQELVQKAHIYSKVGEIYSALGQKEQAVNYYEHALNIYKESEDRQSEGRVLNDLGEV